MEAFAPAPCVVSVEATVIRADGTVEVLGELARQEMQLPRPKVALLERVAARLRRNN